MTNQYNLILGNNIDELKKLPDGSINLTVTSPPYDNLRTYHDSLTWNFDIFKQIADQLYRVTIKGGIVVWIVGDATIDGSETGTSFEQALYFKEAEARIINYQNNGDYREETANKEKELGRVELF